MISAGFSSLWSMWPKQLTVLLVEDEAPIRRVMAKILAARGYLVLQAEDGRAALQIVSRATQQVDLIISDMVMPWIGGQALAGYARAAGHVGPVVFTSGYVTDRSEWDMADRDVLLSKPFSADQLLRTVADALTGTALHQ